MSSQQFNKDHIPLETADFLKFSDQDFNPASTSSPQHRKDGKPNYKNRNSGSQFNHKRQPYSPVKHGNGSYGRQSGRFVSPNQRQQHDNSRTSDGSFLMTSESSFNSSHNSSFINRSFKNNSSRAGPDDVSCYLHSSFTEDPWKKLET